MLEILEELLELDGELKEDILELELLNEGNELILDVLEELNDGAAEKDAKETTDATAGDTTLVVGATTIPLLKSILGYFLL